MKITGVVSVSQIEAPSDPFSQLNITINEDESGLGPSYNGDKEDEPSCVITSTSGADGISKPDFGHETSPLRVDLLFDDCDVVDWSQPLTSMDEITAVGFMSGRACSSNSNEASVTTPLPIPLEIPKEEPEEDPIPKDQDREEFQAEPEGTVSSVASVCPSESGTDGDEIQEVIENNDDGQGQGDILDNCQVMDEELSPGENSSQLYEVDTENVLTESVVGLEGDKKGRKVSTLPPPSKIGKRCFNCLGPHMLRNCPKPKRVEIIQGNRELYRRSKGTPWDVYYHKDTKTLPVTLLEKTYFNPKPGHTSDSLRQALGLGTDDLPLYIYKMRQAGYPPGYLQLAKETLTHGLQLNKQNEVVPLSKLQELNGLLEKIPDYPGFTSVVPAGFFDEGECHGIPYNPFQDTTERREMKYWERQYLTQGNVTEKRNCVNRYISSLNCFLKKLEKITNVQGYQMQELSSERPVKIASKKSEWDDKAELESSIQTIQTLRAFGVSTSVAASAVNVARNYKLTDQLEKQEHLLQERRRRAAETATTLNENQDRSSKRAASPSNMDKGRSRKVAEIEIPVKERKRGVFSSLLGDDDIDEDENLERNDQKADADEDDDIMIIGERISTTNQLGTDKNATKESSTRTTGAGPPRKRVKVNDSSGPNEDDVQFIQSVKNSNLGKNPLDTPPNISETSDMSTHVNLNSNEPSHATAPRTKSSSKFSAAFCSPGTSTPQGGDAEIWASQAKKFSIPGSWKSMRRVKSPSMLEELEPIPSSQSNDGSDYFNKDSHPCNENRTCNNPNATTGSRVFSKVEDSGRETPLNVFQRDGESSQTVQGTFTFHRLPPLDNFAKGMAEIPYEEQPRSGRLSKILDCIQSRNKNQPQDVEDVNNDTNGSSKTQQRLENSLIDLSSDEEDVTFVAEVDPKANKHYPIFYISDSSN